MFDHEIEDKSVLSRVKLEQYQEWMDINVTKKDGGHSDRDRNSGL